MALQAPRILRNAVPRATGIIQTSVVYIGADKIFSTLDGLAGGPLNRIGFDVPVLGRLDAQDIITFLVVNGGMKPRLNSIVAFFVNKFISSGINSIPGIRQISPNSSPASIVKGPAVSPNLVGVPL